MKSIAPRQLSVIGSFAAFIALCGIFAWQVFSASERDVDSTEIQRRLKITAQNVLTPSNSRNTDDDLRLFAVNVIHTALPWRQPFVGYGIYLGQGLVLTAAHVVGRVPFVTHPRVLIAGLNLPATVIKEGSKNKIDLALLSVDQSHLPVILGLRKSPTCKESPTIGADVIVVYPERTVKSKVTSSLQIGLQYRSRFNSLINEPEGSGSAIFNAQTKCLVGIVSGKIERAATIGMQTQFVGYFMPAPAIAKFISLNSLNQ